MALKSIVLGPGECFVLPKDAVVTSIVTEGAITVTSTCGTLPTPVAYKCGVFYLFASNTSGDLGPLDEENTFYTSVTVGNNTYLLGDKVLTGDNPGTVTDTATLNMHLGTDTPIFEFMAVVSTGDDLADRQRIAVYFKVPEDLFDETTLKISDRGTFYILEANEFDCDSYPVPE